jgi:glycosyltransferase involved in cell wall biosynthesis
MAAFSIVIVCKNEAHIIGRSLQSLQGVTDDIIVYDNGSKDGTQEEVGKFNVRLIEGSWDGFGKTKNKATALAKHDWILSLDADEAIDEELKNTLSSWQPGSENVVYNIAFKNFLGERHLAYGEWGRDFHIRLFNRRVVKWDEAPVHEKLVLLTTGSVKNLKGHILHRTIKDLRDYSNKMVYYAMLGAEKYFEQGKKANWIKLHLSPGFNFFKFYILQLGFLDGYAGYFSARMTAWYTFMKYARLKELWNDRAGS